MQTKQKLTIGIVQEKWHEHPQEHQACLEQGIKEAAKQGASVICLQELTLSPYFCTKTLADEKVYQEDLYLGPTTCFLSRIAKEKKVSIIASLYEKAGFNTAVAYNEEGKLAAFTRKQHIPSGEKYHENLYFKPGDSNYPVHKIREHNFGLPTCYDQWFPELSRIYSLKHTEILVYPTAIGAEPTAPQIDTQPLWQKVIIAQGIMANCFMVAINRIGIEDGLEFYGSSFISTPFGEILAEAPRTKPAVLVAELDFTERQLWGKLFPFLQQRQPQTYQDLVTLS